MDNKIDFSIEEGTKNTYGAKIRVIGVGGGGGNMVNHILEISKSNNSIDGVDLIVANTDHQALDNSKATAKIQLGAKLTKGLGAGMKPEVGKMAAEENIKDIQETLEGSDIVFIASGFGGGTGTGAAPVVAKVAKEMGALTVAVVSTPFNFEGRKRMRLALAGITELKKECDSVVIIPNEKLIGLVPRDAGMEDAYKLVDDILAKGVNGMSSLILDPGQINLDFRDVQTAMAHRGLSLMGIGDGTGENAAKDAINMAMQSPLLDNVDINGAMAVLVNLKFNPAYPFFELTEAMNIIRDTVDEEADIFFGNIKDTDMEKDRVEVTIIATGIKDKNAEAHEAAATKPNKKELKQDSFFPDLKKVVNGIEREPGDWDKPTYVYLQQD